jgi:hypothetical protein
MREKIRSLLFGPRPAPLAVVGRVHAVTDLRTGETLKISTHVVARDRRGRVRVLRKIGG